ncbi:GNAT family N-acetyltransferase [Fictibacillus aquaticus]|uniref:N-acetyltransferase domain-containing protein n=1 Tax=Fictibacillus aquaticus TaxID=2021314 RepID=A0A235F855_9BACL|nr:hypothetical protein [Fictibacillus aquaticus]OYD57422.1 hypothetical protein CGZ90_12140 [Fictibacillus aquaticus]
MGIILRQAMAFESGDILSLVGKAGLTAEGIQESIGNYLVVENSDGETIGTVGLERMGEDGLLRSFVLKQDYSTESLLLKLMDKILVYSKKKGVKTIYLLTKSVSFFEQLSFIPVKNEEIPEHIKNSAHYKNNAEEKVVLLSYPLH